LNICVEVDVSGGMSLIV